MIKGKNITLRLFREEDLEEFVALYNQYSQRGEHYPISLRSLAEHRSDFKDKGWWEDHRGHMLICDEQGQMVGTIFFFKGAPYQEGYEVGYTLFRREDRGRGIMSEALPIFSAYLFEAKPIRRLCLITDRDNVASQRVAEKCGYRHEGTLRQSFFLRGEYRDCELYSLLRDECPPLIELLQA